MLYAYILLFILLWWVYQGYVLGLFFISKRIPAANKCLLEQSLPKISVIVPVYNEPQLIQDKIANLKSLDYLDWEVIFIDASSDKTTQIIQEEISGIGHMRLAKADKAHRAYQINQALALCKGTLIVITDVDAAMPQDALKCTAALFEDEKVAVAGACVQPQTAYQPDELFWRIQNNLRCLESAAGHSPVVSGAYYAFKKSLLKGLPENVWADDIYLPFLANSSGYHCLYSDRIKVKELRCPDNFADFFASKVRKACDNIKESLRFVPKIISCQSIWRMIFITRLLQVMVAPTAFYIFLGLTIYYLFVHPIVILSLLFFVLFNQFVIARMVKHDEAIPFLRLIRVSFITNFILIVALFWKAKYVHFDHKPAVH